MLLDTTADTVNFKTNVAA